jgi:hypothetical protein
MIDSSLRLLELFVAILIKWKKSFETDNPFDETKLSLEQVEKWKMTIDQLFQIRK